MGTRQHCRDNEAMFSKFGAKVKIDYFPNLSVKMKGKENLETFRL